MAKLHIIGWRVIVKTPVGPPFGPGAPGKAGLRMNEPTSRIEASHISRLAASHTASLCAAHNGDSRPIAL